MYATEGILVANEKGEIVRINPSAEKLFGYSPDELLYQRVEKLIPGRFSDRHTQYRDNFNHNPHARSMGVGMDLYALKKDGTEFPVEISLSPYASEGKNFVIAFIIDITLRKQAEDKLRDYSVDLEKQVRNRTLILEEAIEELERTKGELNQALQKEKELSELKSRFVSMASHEFRTPLATMMSSLALVTRYGELNEKDKQERHVGKIKSSIHTLTDILNDFLSVSKLEEGKIQNLPERFELTEFIHEIAAEMEGLLKEKQRIVLNITGVESVLLDKKLLRHILFNLISNAVKFSPEDTLIEIGAETQASAVKLSVRDHGMGISPQDQQSLFERFFRGRNATHIQGTGLGLHIVSKYVELMNATLTFESEENKGTTFFITFPQ